MFDVLALPRFRSRLAWLRHRPEPPDFFAGLLVERSDETVRPVLAAGDTGDEQVARRQGRGRSGVVLLPIIEHGFPQHVTGEAVERQDVRAIGFEKETIAGNADTAIRASRGDAGRARPLELPDHSAGSRIEGKAAFAELRGVGRFGDVAGEAYGGVKIDEAASVRVSAHAGDVTVGRLAGPAEISTQKGDVHIAEATSGTVVLRTQVGDVTVGAAHGVSASLDTGTGYGRIHNTLMNTEGATAGLNIHATTGHGDITARSL